MPNLRSWRLGKALPIADFKMEREDPHRVGVIVGAGMGGMVMGERDHATL